MSLAMRNRTVYPTYQPIQVSTPSLTPARGRYSIYAYPGGMEGRLSSPGYTPKWFTHSHTVAHPSANRALHGRESNLQPVDHNSDDLTTTPVHHLQMYIATVACGSSYPSKICSLLHSPLPNKMWLATSQQLNLLCAIFCARKLIHHFCPNVSILSRSLALSQLSAILHSLFSVGQPLS